MNDLLKLKNKRVWLFFLIFLIICLCMCVSCKDNSEDNLIIHESLKNVDENDSGKMYIHIHDYEYKYNENSKLEELYLLYDEAEKGCKNWDVKPKTVYSIMAKIMEEEIKIEDAIMEEETAWLTSIGAKSIEKINRNTFSFESKYNILDSLKQGKYKYHVFTSSDEKYIGLNFEDYYGEYKVSEQLYCYELSTFIFQTIDKNNFKLHINENMIQIGGIREYEYSSFEYIIPSNENYYGLMNSIFTETQYLKPKSIMEFIHSKPMIIKLNYEFNSEPRFITIYITSDGIHVLDTYFGMLKFTRM